jgi:hypothetical protein
MVELLSVMGIRLTTSWLPDQKSKISPRYLRPRISGIWNENILVPPRDQGGRK